MERLKKPVFTKSIPDTTITPQGASFISKWIPLMCAGAAAGISIVALQEMKNVRRELVAIKRENGINDELNKRMNNIEQQIKLLADFVQNKEKVSKETNVIKNAVQQDNQNIQIINEEEYEEIEVTDDDEEEPKV
jgi:hypothetical protein